MSSGQWRVLVLLLILLGLESLRNVPVKAFLVKVFVTPFKGAVSK